MAEPIWHYAIDDQEYGPVSPAHLKELAASGDLRPTDLVWKAGLDDWKPARHVAGLFPARSKAGTATETETGNGRSNPLDGQNDTTDTLSDRPDREEPVSQADQTESEPAASLTGVEQTTEPPVDPQSEQQPESAFSQEQIEPSLEAYSEPPEPPPIEPIPTGTPYAGEYRPQERLHRPRVTAGPVTLRLARWVVMGALLLLVMLQGCESLSSSLVRHREAVSAGAEQAFLAKWEDRRAALKQQRNELQDKTNRNSVEATTLGRILDDLESLDEEMATERAQLEDTQWESLANGAQRAASEHGQWLWWFALARQPLMLLLATGALVLGCYGESQDRWLGIGLALLVAATVLLGGAIG